MSRLNTIARRLAFGALGLLIAIKNSIDAKLAAKQTSPAVKAERVRVTAES